MDIGSLLIAMYATRIGQDGNPNTAQLLSALSSGGGQSPAQMSELIDRLAEQNPSMRLLSQRLREMQGDEQGREYRDSRIIDGIVTPVEGNAQDNDALDAQAVQEAQEAEEATQELQKQLEDLVCEMQQLRERDEQLAWALGACPLCWGDDAHCRSCRGRGHPGYAIPDADAFQRYVLPAARMWRHTRSGDAHAGYSRVDTRANGPDG